MGPERLIQEALQAAGDPSGAFLWRRVCRDLDGELRVGVVAREDAVASRLLRRLRDDRVELVPLRVEGAGPDDLTPTLGAQDRLLGVHAVLWATPATAPLGAEERAGMAAMVAAGAPGRRALVITDLELLERMSDDPEAESRDVLDRVRALAGDDWTVLRADALGDWLATARAQRTELARDRRRTVAGLLLREARRQAEAAVTQAEAEVQRAADLLAVEDGALEDARRRGRRVAAHILGAMRRETQQLLVDLRGFLLELEADLPGQVEAVEALDTVRRTLPHWLHHVVQQWMGDRLASWRARVLEDLAEVALDPEDLERAELLVPSLHPSPVRAEGGWGQRLGVTAAVGGGAAMLLFGLWIPGLLAVTGGLAWSALGRRAAQAANRRALCDAAVDAVRQMGQDAERLLSDQIQALEDELDRLGDDRADVVAQERAVQRAELQAQRTARQERARALRDILDDLDRRIAALGAEAPA